MTTTPNLMSSISRWNQSVISSLMLSYNKASRLCNKSLLLLSRNLLVTKVEAEVTNTSPEVLVWMEP